jgi:hypothetical protein
MMMGRQWGIWGQGKRAAWLLSAAIAIAALGCEKAAAPHARSLRFRGNNSDVWIRGGDANDLPGPT